MLYLKSRLLASKISCDYPSLCCIIPTTLGETVKKTHYIYLCLITCLDLSNAGSSPLLSFLSQLPTASQQTVGNFPRFPTISQIFELNESLLQTKYLIFDARCKHILNYRVFTVSVTENKQNRVLHFIVYWTTCIV